MTSGAPLSKTPTTIVPPKWLRSVYRLLTVCGLWGVSLHGAAQFGPPPAPGDGGTVNVTRSISVPGAQLNIVFKNSFDPGVHDLVESWLREAATAVTTLYGEFPHPWMTIDVHRSGRSRGPVPWGMVARNGGARVVFHIDPAYPLDEFRADWTAVHELSHLLGPYTGRTGRWFGEGLATYMQNTLRARHGMIDERTAWQKTYAGLMRGKKNAEESGLTLREISEGRGWGHIMRIYWSGVAFFLNADVQLRLLSDGRRSLDTTLKAFKACCLHPQRTWDVEEVIAKLDELSNSDIFSAEFERIYDDPEFPDFSNSFDRLGIRVQGEEVRLEGSEAENALREAIAGTANR